MAARSQFQNERQVQNLSAMLTFPNYSTNFHFIFSSYKEDPRISRQGAEDSNDNELPDLDAIAQAGERCVEKVMMVEETIYDDQIVCHHSYSKKCHNTYVTSFEAVQVRILPAWKSQPFIS